MATQGSTEGFVEAISYNPKQNLNFDMGFRHQCANYPRDHAHTDILVLQTRNKVMRPQGACIYFGGHGPCQCAFTFFSEGRVFICYASMMIN